MPYILNHSKLKEGDVILTKSANSTSLRIQKSAGSLFSHAIMFMGNHSFIESNIGGTNFFSTQRFYFANKEDVSLWRLKKPNAELVRKVVEAAKAFSFRGYDLRAVISLEAKTNNVSEPIALAEWNKNLFCSQLIGVSYHLAGLDLFPNVNLDSFTLYHIENSPFLERVSYFLDVITEEEAKMLTLNGEEFELPENFLIEQRIIGQKINKIIQAKYKEFGIEEPIDFQKAIDDLPSLPDQQRTLADRFISEVLKNEGYLDLWQTNKKYYPYFFNVFALNRAILHGRDFPDFPFVIAELEDVIASLQKTIDFQSQNLIVSSSNGMNGYKTHSVMAEMYVNFIRLLNEMKSNCELVLSTFQKLQNTIDETRVKLDN